MKNTRRLILCFLAGFLLLVGTNSWLSAHYVVPIIMYHNVEDVAGSKVGTVSPKTFALQMEYLKSQSYHVISLDQLVSGIRMRQRFPYKTVVLTFDDGYRNNYTQAFPILRKYHFFATFFISPSFVQKEKKRLFMTLEQLKEMVDFGMSFGSHGLTQAYLPELVEAEQDEEIFESKKVLEDSLGIAIDYFAYPVGGYTPLVKQKIQAAGYKGALTTNRGHDRYNRDVYELNRIRLNDTDNFSLILWAKLNGFYNILRRVKDPY